MDNETIRLVMSELGKRSGSRMTPEQRKERARKAIAKRWEKKKPQ